MLLNIKSRGVLAISEIAAQGISGLIWFCPDKEQLEIISGLKEKEIPVVMVGGTLFHEKSLHYVGAVTPKAAGWRRISAEKRTS